MRSATPITSSKKLATARGLRRKLAAQGVTLVELMVVVLLVGVLAIVGITQIRRHMNASRSSEALNMIQSIRSAQERYRATHMSYLNVSTIGATGWFPRDPRPSGGGNGDKRVPMLVQRASSAHADINGWLLLAPTVAGPVQFGYKVNSGLPGQTMVVPDEVPSGLNWGTPVEPWYVIQAIADSDQNGTNAYFLASSLTDSVYSVREGE